MRLPLEVERCLKDGASLSAADAQRLESSLEQQPDDVDVRARLVGYYEARGKEAFRAVTMQGKISVWPQSTSRREALARHAVWLAAHAPRSPLAAHPLLRFSMSDPVYPELSSIWRRHVAADTSDSTVFANAITFFWRSNDIFADELLARAEELFPGDERWLNFRRDRRAHELDLAFRFQSSRDRGHALGVNDDARRAEDQRAQRLDEIEQLLREGECGSEWAPRLREIAGEISLDLGRIERARAHAEEMVTSTAAEPERGYSDAVHNGHLLLGRISLRENDIERARAHLVLAGQAGATQLVPIFGPDMRLAADLLARGDRDVVIRYLSLCRSFWGSGPVDEWIDQIRAGDIPDFGRNLKASSVD